MAATLAALFLINMVAQIDRMLPFILSESIKSALALSDPQMGLVSGLASAVCYSLLSLPLARKISPDRRGLAIGIFSMRIPNGAMVGFAVGGAMSDTLGWRVALFGAGALGALAVTLTFLVIRLHTPVVFRRFPPRRRQGPGGLGFKPRYDRFRSSGARVGATLRRGYAAGAMTAERQP